MNYFYDVAVDQFVDASGSTRPLHRLSFMREEDMEMAIRLQTNGGAYTPSGTASLTFAIKATPGESAETLAIIESDGFTESSGVYTGTLALDGQSLSDLLGTELSIGLYAQLAITDDNGTIKSKVIPVAMSNDIVRGNEGTPSALPNPDDYIAARAVLYDRAQALSPTQKTQAKENIGLDSISFDDLEDVPATFPPSAHDHVVSDITPVASQRLIGRHAGGSGDAQEVTVDGGLEFHGSGIRRAALTGDVTASAGNNATTLANTGVAAGSYTAPTLTVDAKGRITAAASAEYETPAGAAAKIAFANRTAKQRPYRLAIAGDSITDQNSIGGSYYMAGYAAVARSILHRRFELVWRAWNTKPASSPSWSFGSSGFSAVQFRDGDGSGELPMQDIQNVYEQIDGVFVLLGSNPGADVNVDAAAIQDIWDTLLAAGKDVYAAEVLPRSSTVTSAATVAARIIALNALLKPAAASRGIPFLEWHSDFADENGYCSLVDMPDGVHLGFIGAQKAARLFAAFMSPFVSTHGWEAPDAASTAWLTVNPYMMGTDASTPTNWTFPASATAQTVVRDSLGRWKRITNTQANYSMPTYRQTLATGTWKVGDRVRGVMRVRAASAGFDMRAFVMRLVKTGGSTVSLYAMDATSGDIAEETGSLDGLDDMIYITPEYIVPSDATGLYIYFGPGGTGSFDVMYCGIVAAERFDS